MKELKYLFLIITISGSLIYYSCDDAGTNPVFVPKGLISFSHSNLKPLDQNLDGLYTLWLGLDSSGSTAWYILGKFNINAYSQIVDSLGNSMVFTFPGDTTLLGNAKIATVTVGNSGPLGSVLISNDLTAYTDSLATTLWMAHDEAFGDVGRRILGVGYTIAHIYYHVSSPTSNYTLCRGIWFCDTLGNSAASDGLALTPGNGWVYEGWLKDKSSNTYYSMGRFYDPYIADLDGAGSCAGNQGPPFNKPGQDWITTGTGCPNITNIFNGNYAVFISVEPENESGMTLSSPFFLKPFYQDNIISGCKRLHDVSNQAVVGIFPTCRLKITN